MHHVLVAWLFHFVIQIRPHLVVHDTGKTTMLNHILNSEEHKMKFAVIENELGAVTIDDQTLSENIDEEIIEVINGCVCCKIRGDLVVALTKLYKRVHTFDGVIIETTGLADPAPIVQTFFVNEDLQQMYKLDSVITVVDAKNVMARLDEKKAEGVDNEAVQQLCFADKIILNKTDLVEGDEDEQAEELEQIELHLRGMNPTAPVLKSSYSRVAPKELLNIQAFNLDRVLDFDPDFLGEEKTPKHDRRVTAVSTKLQGEMSMTMLNHWLEHLIGGEGENLYRYKGVIAVKEMEEKFVFQGVGMMFTNSVQGKWKPGEERTSSFVFIGKNLKRDFLKDGFKSCLVSSAPLRFAIGAKIMARCNGYQRGKVMYVLGLPCFPHVSIFLAPFNGSLVYSFPVIKIQRTLG